MSRTRKPQGAPTIPPLPDPGTPAARDDRRIAGHAWRILALWALALAAYSNSFQGGLVFDNTQAILGDARVHEATSQNLHLILTEEYWHNFSTTGLYRPLTTFSYLVNYAVLGNGPNPAGYHLVNLVLHAVNILLVYLLGLLILEQPAVAWALAAVWGVHPMLTESVTNIVGRADLLAGMGVLGGLLCHVAATSATGRRRAAWLAGVALSAAIGIFAKESAAVLPGVLLLYDLTWDKAQSWRKRAVSYFAVGVPFAIYFSLRSELHARLPLGLVPVADNPLTGADFWTARLTAVKVIGRYLTLWIWPEHLSADYSYNTIPLFGWRLSHWEDMKALIALAACIGCAVLAIRSYRRRKLLFFFVVFFFVTLAPTANLLILIGTDMAERFVYLPSIAFAAGLVIGVRAIVQRFAGASPAAYLVPIGVIAAALGVRTYIRNFDWRDERSLWTSATAASPGSFKAHSLLAGSLAATGTAADLDRAVSETDRTLEILGGLPDEDCPARPFASAAWCYRLKGDSLQGAGATEWYRKALAALLRGERADAAEREMVRRVNLAAGKRASAGSWMPLYLELGRIYLRLSEPQKALEALTYGRSRSADPEFIREMARALRASGDWEKAATVLIEGMVIDPNSTLLAHDLVELYQQASPDSCAIHTAGGQTGVDMNCPLVHGHICAASRNVALSYRQTGQAAKAAAAANTAIRELGCPAEMFQ